MPYARWNADAVRDDLRAYAADHLGADGAVLIVEEIGSVKKGHSSTNSGTGSAARRAALRFPLFPDGVREPYRKGPTSTGCGRLLLTRVRTIARNNAHGPTEPPKRRTFTSCPSE
jgi:hypothetical protein